MTRLSRRLPPLAAVLLAAVLVAAGALPPAAAPARAESSLAAKEAVYTDYYRAVAAYGQCRKKHLGQAAHDAIAHYVEQQGMSEIGTKRLLLIQQAKDDIRAAGCNSPLATEALQRFDRELAPLLP
ncbi:hypothetical protein SAMN06265365_102403 [Tistlia consotensis]|uniref:HdeA/HdeB family protein n=1 Tax=Tistlia consotensis USBA 355 TaxID=560819 RepID=A0A1Y6C5Z0_9PROT|nr:hypothetical protein [Tistlia consotensis]SMF38695.1 hypothetical protein SAMN05428998_11360 [Tistlia consotensis USBA 355]SNR36908.1 hypothetical protein SAMN06265365_102403 [Tistlia consotensis]